MESQPPPALPPTGEPVTAIIEPRAAGKRAAFAEPGAERGFALDRASLDQIVRDVAAHETDRIRAAIERADYDDAAVRALARAKLGLPLSPELVADLLVGVDRIEVLLALARHAGAEALDPLLDLYRSGRFSDDPPGADQQSATAFVLWQLQRPEVVRPVLVPRLRRMARRRGLFVRAAGLAGWLASQLGDPHLSAVFEEHYGRGGGKLAETVGRFALDLWNAPLDEIIAMLPARASEDVLPGTPVRAAPKVGRNEPCPCGSGKKFKRCCADRPDALPAAAGPSRAERLHALEPRLERDQVDLLSRADLARLDLTRLRDGTVIEITQRQAQLRDWHRACLAVDELARRRGKDFADGHLQSVIREALRARHHDVARQLLDRSDLDADASALRLEAALAVHAPDALARADAFASVAMEEKYSVLAVDLAHAMLSTVPALGILVARGALRAGHELDNEMLLEEIEEARDDLGLPPGDPAHELFAALGGVHEKHRKAAEIDEERAGLARTAASLRADLDATTARLAAMQRQVADHQRELERAERAAAERPSAEAGRGAAPPAAEEQERRALRSKIEELQALIRERNEERGELRRQLSATTDHKPGAPAAAETTPLREREPEPEGADDEAEELPDAAASRPVQIPRFAAAAAAALEVVPRSVAAGAMRRVGALAAGDPAAWRAIKQAKDMPRQVLMARIGIHHRLLFRSDGGLEVLDLVTRESLLTTLKRLRSA